MGFLEISINAFGNGVFGVEFSNGASNDRITATTVAATTGNGVVITGSLTSNDALTGDFIGTDPTGNLSFLFDGYTANTGSGVVISGGANHITVSTSVISNNDEQGVSISGADTEFNALTGDWIGTNRGGSYELRNGGDGVLVTSLASFNTIGGTSIAARDIISGNGADGVSFSGDSDNEVLGDYIGLDPTGTVRVTNGTNGVLFSGSSNDTVGGTAAGAGDVISGSNYNGVAITAGSTGILVAGDLIGTDASGGQRIVNNVGVLIDGGAKSNTIGGTTAGARDVISADESVGVLISDSGTSDNVVEGDFIGTNAAGTLAVINYTSGVEIAAGATANTIGGTTAGARDVISGNFYNGVVLDSPGTKSNVVEGDYVGTDATGTKALANGAEGVNIYGGATANTVGGITAGARNVISGNTSVGVYLSDAGTSANLVEGDYIGTDLTGAKALANGLDGVQILGGATSNTLGGTTGGACDVISGNASFGVCLSAVGTSANVVEGDYIGTDLTGGKALANGVDGLQIVGGATSNTVGGTTAAARDVISGNTSVGVYIMGTSTSDNVVEGDYIGTSALGTAAVPNAINGLDIVSGATSNTIGGSAAGAGDVISGNTFNGVALAGAGTESNLIEGDYIGTDWTGGKALANSLDGVQIVGGATSNTVGGTTAGDRDVISGNASVGVFMSDPGTSGNVVEGDYIGTDLTGGKALANGLDGVLIVGGATSNTVGGTTAAARDVISGNASVGVYIMGSSTSDNVVEGDYIGTSAAGTAAVPNAINGVDIVSGATSNTVGGTTAGARDVISGNTFNGVVLAFSGTSYNVVLGDYIGTDDTGAKALANGQDGVDLIGGATSNIVGGLSTNDRNVISGNSDNGVLITDPGTAYNDVQGNYIGTDSTGAIAVPNSTGVLIQNAASSNAIGGSAAVYRNIISGNVQCGVIITDAGTIGNTVRFNSIGTDSTGELPVCNGVDGVIVENGAADSYVYNNLISANGSDGVLVSGTSTSTNYIESNSIGLDSTGLKALKQTGRSYSNLTGVAIDGATNTFLEYNFISGNSTGIYVGAGATSNSISYDEVGTGTDGLTNVGNLQDGVVLDGVSGNVIDYDVLVYNGNVGIFFENGATETSDLLAYGTFTLTVNGVTYGNKNGAIELS